VPEHPIPKPKTTVPQALTDRLFRRASELDAFSGSETSVADLREAATEAGISPTAFQTALTELQRTLFRQRLRRWVLASGLIAILAVGALITIKPGVSSVAGPGMVEEAILIHCLNPGDAAELIGPLLRLRTNKVVANPSTAPHVLTILGTPQQLDQVRALLQRDDGLASSGCTSR
jgi:hypothetical protein